MITMKGESVLMNNLFKETKNLIKYIALGNDNTPPQYLNTSLGNEILRTPANINYSTNQKSLIASGDFNISDLENVCEIGLLTTQGDLITHDIFQGVPGGYESTIHLEYNLMLEPFFKIQSWKKTQYTGVYLNLINDTVEAVYEKTTNAGYAPQTSLNDVKDTPASFYYDENTRQLYIHPSMSEIDPVNLNIHVKTR
jgi:hypothetical protein